MEVIHIQTTTESFLVQCHQSKNCMDKKVNHQTGKNLPFANEDHLRIGNQE